MVFSICDQPVLPTTSTALQVSVVGLAQLPFRPPPGLPPAMPSLAALASVMNEELRPGMWGG